MAQFAAIEALSASGKDDAPTNESWVLEASWTSILEKMTELGFQNY